MIFLRKLRSLFRKDKLDAEMAEEMRHHVELQMARNLQVGMNPEEARYAALRQFGNVASIQEQAREARSWVWLEQVWQDLRYAVRSLWRTPGFTLTVILTLALGLGVNSALFSVFNAVALRSLPLKHSDELVNVVGQNELGWHIDGFSYPDYLDLRNGRRDVPALSVWTETVVTMEAAEVKARSFMIKGGPAGALAYLPLQLVSQNYFDVVGVDLALGRGFRPEEDLQPGASPVIVLQHRFWEQQFHGDPNVLGRTIKLQDRVVFTVIGVAAPEFVGTRPAPPIGWVPATMLDTLMGKGSHRLAERQSTEFQLVARVPVELDREQARAELEVLTRQLLSKYPAYGRKSGIVFESRTDDTNIDVNRNFTDYGVAYPQDELYPLLFRALCPDEWTDETIDWSGVRDQLARDFGVKRMVTALGGGQIVEPTAMNYIGTGPSWSRTTVERLLPEVLASARKVGFIEWHTGLGKFGGLSHICMMKQGSPGYERVFSWLGDEARSSWSASMDFTDGVTPDYRGWFSAWLPSIAPQAEWAGLVVEVGTYDVVAVIDALRMDRWLKFGRGRSSIPRDEIRKTMMERLYPVAPEWRAAALRNGLDAQARVLNGLQQW